MREKLFVLVLAACSSSPQLNITKSIGTAGGTVANGDSSVQIPAGALGTTANITIAAVDAPAPANAVVVGPAFDFGPDGQVFAMPVTVTLPYDTAKIPSGKSAGDILIYTAPLGSANYTALSATVAGNTVQTQTTHFTVYLPAVPTTTAVDLGMQSNPDLACGVPSCFPTSSSPGGCECTQSCRGQNFVMSCTGSTSASCTCAVNGTVTKSFAGDCSSPSGAESVFFSQCGASP
jgi:hypothetical protein